MEQNHQQNPPPPPPPQQNYGTPLLAFDYEHVVRSLALTDGIAATATDTATTSNDTTGNSAVTAAKTTTATLKRVEVNQRALIDKILARYASASAVYRELLQNSNDAGASRAEIHFRTTGTSTTTTTTGSTTSTISATATRHHSSSSGSAKKNSNNKDLVTQVVYRNNGAPFAQQDWDRLQKIAEGNPDVSKVGAFGVGAYTMFSITEEPVICSGNTALRFVWQGDALYTSTTALPTSPAATNANIPKTAAAKTNIPAQTAAAAANANMPNAEEEWTTFLLPSRDPYPLPAWPEFGEFLAAALTFTNALRDIVVTVNGAERLRVTKRILQPPRPVLLVSSSSSSATSNSTTMMMRAAAAVTATSQSSMTATAAAFLWNFSTLSGIGSSTTTTTTTSTTSSSNKDSSTNTSASSAAGSVFRSSSNCVTKTELFALNEVQESVVRLTVRVSAAANHANNAASSATASMDARYISATAKTSISADMARRMERVTKKQPPANVTVQIFLNYNEPTAKLAHNSNNSSNSNEQQELALGIAQSFAPVLGRGRIFIGFRTSQTTGLAAHVAAPFVPTVEREAMDLQDAVLAKFNTQLLEFSGILLRLALEHTMRNVIDVAWQAGKVEREALELKLEESQRSAALQQQQQPHGKTKKKTSENGAAIGKEFAVVDKQKTKLADEEGGEGDESVASSGIMSFARYMARGVKKKIVSVAKSVESLMEGDGSEHLLYPEDPRPLADEEKQAIVLMSSFCPQQSTPDVNVGAALAQGFSRCMPNSAPPVLTKSGVVSGNEARLPHYGIEGFVSDGVIRTVVVKNAEEYHTVVARCRRLNFYDVMTVVSNTVLEQEKAVNLIKWWTRFSKIDGDRYTVQTRGIQLKEAIRYYARPEEGKSGQDGNRKVVSLNELHFFTETNSPFAGRDVPMPETVISGALQEAIGMTALTSDVLQDVWFSPMPIEIFAEFISRHDCLNAAKPEDELLRAKVLTVLCREFMRRQGPDRSVFGGLCHGLLANRRCIPFDSDQPTQLAADYPADLYLYSAELKAFDGVGSFHKVAGSLQSAGVTDEFLVTLGVRKSVSIDFLFSHLDTLSWSQNPKALVEYLRSATLTPNDLNKLATTKYLPSANDNSTTFAPGELHLPNKDLRILPFVKMLAWPESDVSESSENGKFLRRLGMKTLPSLIQVLSYLSQDNLKEDQRALVLGFVCDRLVPHGAYYISYNAMALTEKKKYRFLPCVEQNPIDPGASSSQRHSPVTCFSDPTCAVMGFPVIDPKLGKQGNIYGSLFQCDPEPHASYLLTQLAHLVAVAKDRLKSNVGKDQMELCQCIEAAFQDIFKYLSHRSSDLNFSSLETLSRESFIPCVKDDKIVWQRPDEVFFRRSHRSNDTLTEELFHVIDFSPFLAAAGVKEDATTKDLFQKMIQSPEGVLRTLGSEKKYRSLLRRVAADPPFPIARPSAAIKNAPFLLAYTFKPFSEEKNDKHESSVEDKTTYHLAKAEDIYVIDNSNFGRMFPVYRAPPETDLEDFYIRLGSRYISKSVERRFEVVGSPKTDTSLTIALKERLRERGPLLVSPNITSRPLVPGAASILDEKRLEFYEAANLLAVYTLGKTTRRSSTTCFSRPNGKKNAIFVTSDFDLFDAGQAIGDLILKRCQLEDAFFFSSLLETPLDQLRARGFPVDRILKPEPVVVPEDPKPKPVIAPQVPSRIPVPAAKGAEASRGQVDPVPPTARPPTVASTNPAGPAASTESMVGGEPPAATGSKADILMQMFPDADPSFIQAALGSDPSVDDVKELADKMANGHYPKNHDADADKIATSNDSIRDSAEDSLAKKKSLRQRLGRAFGGKRGSSSGGTQLPPQMSPGHLGNVGGGFVAPPSSTNHVEQRGPVSPAADAHTQSSLEKMLEQSVGTSNRVQKDDIDAPETNLTSIPPDLDRGQTCEVIPGHSLKPFLGPRGNGLTHNGILVFSSKAHTSSETFLVENGASLHCFADVLERLCAVVFGLKLSSVAIYHDPAGVTIAFNRNKALHFNFRFFHGLHFRLQKHNTSECYAYWFVTICHELAHHLVSGHTKEHGFYCENFSQLYMPKLMALLRELKID